MARDLDKMLQDYRRTTAQILYHLPDHPHILQTYVWQEYDLAPKFPVLRKFLHFWETELEGKLHSVMIAHVGVISAAELRHASAELYVH